MRGCRSGDDGAAAYFLRSYSLLIRMREREREGGGERERGEGMRE